jgi:hypothetical protein
MLAIAMARNDASPQPYLDVGWTQYEVLISIREWSRLQKTGQYAVCKQRGTFDKPHMLCYPVRDWGNF